MRRVVLVVLLLLLACPAAASARAGDVDGTYGVNGRSTFTVGTAGARVAGLAARPDGSAVVTGTALDDNGDFVTFVTHLLPDGAPDPYFGNGGTTLVDPVTTRSASPGGVALNPDGSAIVITNALDGGTGEVQVRVVRVLPDGTQDTTFGDHGVAVLSAPFNDVRGQDVAIDSAGRILVAASVQSRGKHTMSAFRLSPLGQLDPTFGGGRVDLDNAAAAGAILPRPGGGAILTGHLYSFHGNYVTAQVDDLGELVDTFAGSGRSHVRLSGWKGGGSGPTDMVLGPNHSLLVAGNYHERHGHSRIAVARISASGYLNRRWSTHGVFRAGTYRRPLTVQAMVRDSAGRLLLAGAVHNARTGAQDALIMRLTPRGHLDRRFGSGGRVVRHLGQAPDTRFVDSFATALALTPRRVLVAGNAFDDVVDPTTNVGRAWPAVMRLYAP